MSPPSPDAPGQGEAEECGEVEALARGLMALDAHRWSGPADRESLMPHYRRDVERFLLPRLAAHDASVAAAARADAEGRLGEVRARDQRRYDALAETLHKAVLRAEQAEVLAGRLLTIHGEVVMDTPEDRALHDQVLATFRAVLDAAAARREGG